MVPSLSPRTKVFISYSHKDAKYAEQLIEHLAYDERNNLIETWSDKKINAGAQWREEIKLAIDFTKVAVLLISSSFLASKFIAENELPPLLRAAEKEGAIILPVIVRPSNFEDTELANFQAVNNPSMPVAKMKGYQRDEFWTEVIKDIKRAITPQQTVKEISSFHSASNTIPAEILRLVHQTQQLNSSLNSLPIDYTTRILNFFTQYVGTPHQPVPFGGREDDINYLDTWLDNFDLYPYLLLLAPAGRGKSALLVQWSQQLISRDDLTVIFIPVSVRFRTNLAGVVFATLATRLAAFHNEQVEKALDTPSEIWRRFVLDYLSRSLPDGQRLLLILDGVDEAADWIVGPDLFPLNPPKGLKIILSTRNLVGYFDADSWKRRLRWEQATLACSMDLKPLTCEGVANTLQNMGFPLNQLGTRSDIVAELHRLSEGDPLLVRLYLDNLWKRGEAALCLQPKELHTIRPGMEGYFDVWWEEQHILWADRTPLCEPAVQAILNALSYALGPLNYEDLLRLVPSKLHLTTWTLEEVLRPLERFVIGDGRHQGYAFSHSRLGTYFWERLSKFERQEVEVQFLSWGKEVLTNLNNGQLSLKQVPPYLIQYYSSHLERMECNTEVFLLLVSKGWQQAWKLLEGSYAGFLNDVAKAWSTAEQDNLKKVKMGESTYDITSELRCALCMASVNSLSKNIPVAILIEAVKRGIWTATQGLAYACQVPEIEQRVKAMIGIFLHTTGPSRTEILQQILTLAQEIEDKQQRVWLLTDIAPYIPEKAFYEILQTIKTLKDAFFPLKAMSKLLHVLPESLLWEALEIIQNISPVQHRANLQVIILPRFAKAGLPREALEIVRKTKIERDQTTLLTNLYQFLPRSLEEEVLGIALNMTEEENRAEVLSVLMPHLVNTVHYQKILANIRKMQYGASRAKVLANLSTSSTEILLEALMIAQETKNEEYRTLILVNLSSILPDSIRKLALRIAQNINNDKYRAEALVRLAPYFPEKIRDIIQLGLKAARETKVKNEKYRLEALINLFSYLPIQIKREVMLEILLMASNFRDESLLMIMLEKLIPSIPDELAKDVLPLMQKIENEEERAEILTRFFPLLSEQLQIKVMQFIENITDQTTRAQALVRIIPSLPSGIMIEVFKITQNIKIHIFRVQVLAKMLPFLPKQLQEKIVLEIIQETRSVDDLPIQAQVFIDSAPFMSKQLVVEVFNIVQEFDEEYWEAKALIALTPFLSGNMLRQAMKRLQTIETVYWEESWLKDLASSLSKASLHEILENVQEIEDKKYLTKALMSFSLLFPQKLLKNALEESRNHKPLYWRVETLAKLAEIGYPEEALELALTIKSKYWKAKALVELLPLLSEELLPQALDSIWSIESSIWQAELLLKLVKAGYPEYAVKIAGMIVDERYRAIVLTTLAYSMPKTFIWVVMQIVLKIENSEIRLETLSNLIPWLTQEGYIQEALRIIHEINDKKFQIQILSNLTPSIADLVLKEVINPLQIFNSLSGHQSNQTISNRMLMLELVPYLSNELLRKSLKFIPTIENEWIKSELLLEIIPRLAELGSPQDALNLALTIKDPNDRIMVLTKMVSYLPISLVQKIENDVLTMYELDEFERFGAFLNLATAFPEQFLPEAILIAGTYSVENRTIILTKILPTLSQSSLWDILALAHEIEDEEYLCLLLNKIISSLPKALLLETLKISWQIKQKELRSDVLINIAPMLAETGYFKEALEITQTIDDQLSRASLITKFIPFFLPSHFQEFLDVVKTIEESENRSRVLAEMISYLVKHGFFPEALTTLHRMKCSENQAVTEDEIENEELRTRSLTLIASHLADLPPSTLYPFWCNLLHILSFRTRQGLLNDLSVLAPIILALGGAEAIIETSYTIQEVVNWWP